VADCIRWVPDKPVWPLGSPDQDTGLRLMAALSGPWIGRAGGTYHPVYLAFAYTVTFGSKLGAFWHHFTNIGLTDNSLISVVLSTWQPGHDTYI
jgi:hypothetical protein